METVSKLRFWCYKILPLVYDDSLSYYEAICKATQKLNEVIGNVNELPDYINKEIAEQIGNNGDLFDRLFAKIIKAVATCIDDTEFTSEEKFGGEIFWHNGELVECVKHMTVGTNYVLGDNIEVVNIIDLMNDIKSYISTKTEKYNDRADREIQLGEYLFWKDKFLKAKQIIANDTILTDDMFEEVCIGDELKLETDTRVAEVARVDKRIDDETARLDKKIDYNVENIQAQVTSNDADISALQQRDIELKANIDTNDSNINTRVSNIVAQSGTDNTEIVDARKLSTKLGDSVKNTLYDSISNQINRSINYVATFSPDTMAKYIPSKDLLDAHANSIYAFYGFTDEQLVNGPVGVRQGIILIYSPTPLIDSREYKVYLLMSIDKKFYVGSCFKAGSILWHELTTKEDVDKLVSDLKDTIDASYKTTFTSNSYTIFQSVGCIGDSYTAGYVYVDSEGVGHEYKDYSWPAVMEKASGNKYYNYGLSGANAKTWQSRGGFDRINNRKCQAYLIGLGINDSSDTGNALELGVTDDIGTDNDTFYAWYTKLIKRTHEINDKAYIICMTIGTKTSSTSEDYNEAIRNIVNSLATENNCFLLDLHKYQSIYDNNIGFDKYHGHYTPRGYAIMQKITAMALSDLINSNNAFRTVYTVPYDK